MLSVSECFVNDAIIKVFKVCVRRTLSIWSSAANVDDELALVDQLLALESLANSQSSIGWDNATCVPPLEV